MRYFVQSNFFVSEQNDWYTLVWENLYVDVNVADITHIFNREYICYISPHRQQLTNQAKKREQTLHHSIPHIAESAEYAVPISLWARDGMR